MEERQNNNQELIERLLKEHGDKVYSFAFRLTRNNADMAAELTQEAFLKAFEQLDRYDTRLPFQNWIMTILRNLYLDWLKRFGPTRMISLHDKKEENREFLETLAHPAPNPTEAAAQEERKIAIQKALGAIPPDFRAPLILCDIEGFSYEEISQIIDCPVGTVRSRIHRARKMFKELIAPYLREDGEVEAS